MEAEYKSLCANQVWDLVPPPENCKIISSKWVYKCKRPGIDYEETFSPVVRFELVHSVIALAVHKDMKLHQMDVKTAFLNGKLSEEVFMKQPEGFVKEGEKDLVCRLKKSIYGLKQSPRCWNTALDSHLKKMKFVQTKADPCIYVFKDKTETVIIAVYVDDILIAGTSNKKIAEVKAAIANCFEVKDMGEFHYFLGVKIVRDSQAGTIWLGQPSYSENIVQDFHMENANVCRTPTNPSLKLTEADETSTYADTEKYQSAVGKLLFLSTRTRPDIAFAVSTVAKFTSNPTEQHWKAVKHIIPYIAGTINYGLMFTRSETTDCTGFSDADWAGDVDDCKSTSGYIFSVGGAPVSWKSRKNNPVLLSRQLRLNILYQ